MTLEPIGEIEVWSKKLAPWRQDALRRLAVSNELSGHDFDELLAMIKKAAGFLLTTSVPAPVPFAKVHFGGGKQKPIVLKSIANVQNVNRLVAKARLDFCPKALTVIYGRNGSGKSGFVRILRTACRTRVENPAKLKVLSDVYGGSTVPQSAEIIIDAGKGDTPVAWSAGMTAAPELMPIAVFDTLSAQLYVDGGSQIRYLPFGLALPHRLNSICLKLKEFLDAERVAVVGDKASLTEIIFPVQRDTKAQLFDRELAKATTDAKIDDAAKFSAADQEHLDEITAILSAGSAAVADLTALIGWVESIADECETTATAFSDTALFGFTTLRKSAVTARQTAQLSASALFTDEPLPGVGSESWRALWAAARDYSVSDAYSSAEFPVTKSEAGPANCVLCQQPLLPEGTARLQRFQKYMDDTLDVAATKAEQAVSDALDALPSLTQLSAEGFADRCEQIRRRDPKLADALLSFQLSATQRHQDAIARLAGDDCASVPALDSPHALMRNWLRGLQTRRTRLLRLVRRRSARDWPMRRQNSKIRRSLRPIAPS